MKSEFFELKELVSEQVYKRYGKQAWDFFDPRLIKTIDFLKSHYDWTITINDWSWGGSLQQRGFRANLDPLVKNKTDQNKLYCSAHGRGQGVDFNVKGLSAEKIRQILIEDHNLLPYNVRIEDGVSWVHLDVVDKNVKVYLFST